MAKEYKLSPQRLKELQDEMNYLKTVREKEVAELIKEARSFGDLSENSEYDEAKNEQGKLYSRIAELEDILSNYVVIEEEEQSGDYVRLGSILYGFYGGGTGHYGDFPVKNGVYLKSRVMQVKDIPAGSSISYGPLFTTVRDTRIAIFPIGFADGLRRALSNVGKMMIHGQWAPIIGKICCDHTILDVTDLPDVKRGDYVTIWGRDGGLEQTPGDYARLVGATAAETTAVLNQRIPRIALPSKA